jgi:hypothetical protein
MEEQKYSHKSEAAISASAECDNNKSILFKHEIQQQFVADVSAATIKEISLLRSTSTIRNFL